MADYGSCFGVETVTEERDFLDAAIDVTTKISGFVYCCGIGVFILRKLVDNHQERLSW